MTPTPNDTGDMTMTATATPLAADFQRLDDVLDVYGEEEAGSFAVTTLDQAEWAARKLAAARSRMAERKAVADDRMTTIARWLVEANASDDQAAQYMEGLLEQYHSGVRDQDPKRGKSVKLPHGVTLKSREADAWEWQDDEAFVAWAQEHAAGLLRERDPEVDKVMAKKTLEVVDGVATFGGQPVPGVKVRAGVVTYSVTVDA